MVNVTSTEASDQNLPARPRPGAIEIRELTVEFQNAWNAYVLAHQYGTPFHLIAWKDTIQEAFGYRPMYLVAVEGATIRGVLPLFLVNNFLMGKVLLSTPFAVYGGILADSAEVRELFARRLAQLGESLKVDYVELRNAYPEQNAGFTSVTNYVTFGQPIGADEPQLLEGIPRKTRRMVRRSLEASLETRQQQTDFAAFEDLYSRNLQRLGTPAFPRRHFTALLRNFGKQADIREVVHQGRVIAAVMTLYFRDQVLPYYGASDPEFNALAPNNYMYFDLMRWGGNHGYTWFDFGRSKKISGSHDFKTHWGMVERDLPYEVLLVKRKTLPSLNPNDSKFEWPIKIWQRLPLWVTRSVGPRLLRLVP
jgi:FemAB-related protein (PEP-CTERM system-associated)